MQYRELAGLECNGVCGCAAGCAGLQGGEVRCSGVRCQHTGVQ